MITIEPAEGDIARGISPHRIGPHNAYIASLNRNKKSIVLDLGSEEGRLRLGELVATACDLITNLRPAAIRKLGLTYEALKQWNSKLVCVVLTGYGLDSPYSERPAYAPLGVVVAPVETLEQALASEQTLARNMRVEIDTPNATIRGVGNPIKIFGVREELRAPPLLGVHGMERNTR